jgi:hypothetical protein
MRPTTDKVEGFDNMRSHFIKVHDGNVVLSDCTKLYYYGDIDTESLTSMLNEISDTCDLSVFRLHEWYNVKKIYLTYLKYNEGSKITDLDLQTWVRQVDITKLSNQPGLVKIAPYLILRDVCTPVDRRNYPTLGRYCTYHFTNDLKDVDTTYGTDIIYHEHQVNTPFHYIVYKDEITEEFMVRMPNPDTDQVYLESIPLRGSDIEFVVLFLNLYRRMSLIIKRRFFKIQASIFKRKLGNWMPSTPWLQHIHDAFNIMIELRGLPVSLEEKNLITEDHEIIFENAYHISSIIKNEYAEYKTMNPGLEAAKFNIMDTLDSKTVTIEPKKFENVIDTKSKEATQVVEEEAVVERKVSKLELIERKEYVTHSNIKFMQALQEIIALGDSVVRIAIDYYGEDSD